MARKWRSLLALVLVAAAAVTVGLVSCVGGSNSTTAQPDVVGPVTPGGGGTATRPNIVFVLTDDLSWNLVRWMPHVQALQHAGMTFTNYTVTDSLCCPSRASIFTGDYPHNTKVLTNAWPDGGARRFRDNGDDKSTFATGVHGAGYRTGFLGKYLNEYEPTDPAQNLSGFLGGAYIPPGWDRWYAVDGYGYNEYDYDMTDGHEVHHHGHAPQDFLNTVDQQMGERFAVDSAASRKPFLLEIASYAPHNPYVAAPQDQGTFPGVRVPRTAAFNTLPRNAPAWLAGLPPLTRSDVNLIDFHYRQRVEAVQSVDRMVGALQRVLAQLHQLKDTVFVFSSDNGYHMGEYRLRAGKQTAFDTDVRVPLVIAGPGIPAGVTSSVPVENVDLRPTFDELAGAATPSNVDGHSLVPLLHGEHPPWRTLALVEHHNPAPDPSDPDQQDYVAGLPPDYIAIRSRTFTFVRYRTGEIEYYDRSRTPDELDNTAAMLSKARLRQLTGWLDRLHTCRGATSCWQAGRPAAADAAR